MIKHLFIKIELPFILLLSMFLLNLSSCKKGTEKKVGIMTFVSHEVLNSIEQGIIERLLELGYKKEQIVVYNANGEMDKVHAFVKEMVNANFDILIPITTPVSQAMVKVAGGKIPVVYSFVSDPTSLGVDLSSGKTPLNVTGISDIINYKENLKLIKRLFPNAKKVGMIYNASESQSLMGVEECRTLAPSIGLKLVETTVASTSEVLPAARLLVSKVDVFYVGGDNTVVSGITAIIKVARETKKPVFASDIGSVKQGAVAAISVNYKDFGRKTAEIVDQILKGKSPNDIPPQKYIGDYLVINSAALNFWGIKIDEETQKQVKETY